MSEKIKGYRSQSSEVPVLRDRLGRKGTWESAWRMSKRETQGRTVTRESKVSRKKE